MLSTEIFGSITAIHVLLIICKITGQVVHVNSLVDNANPMHPCVL